MERLILCFLVFFSASAQWEEFTCNHYMGYPTGVCYQYTESTQYYFECNGTDTLIYNVYANNSCGTSDAEPQISYTISADEFINSSYIPFNCDNDDSDACDHATIRYYSNDDCTGDFFAQSILTDQCLVKRTSSGDIDYSWAFSCSESTITATVYFNSDDCTDTGNTVQAEFRYLNGTSCYNVTCDGAATDIADDGDDDDDDDNINVEVGPYDCNVGYLWDTYPFVEGKCSWIENENGVYSYKIECQSDGNSATLYTYENGDCSGTPVDEENVYYYYCKASGDDCSTVELGVTYYDTNRDCSGDWHSRGELQLAKVDDCVNVGQMHRSVTVSNDVFEINYYYNDSTYSNHDCDGTPSYSITWEDGCNQRENNNNIYNNTSWYVSISSSEYDGVAQLGKNIVYGVFNVILSVILGICWQLFG